MRSDNRRLRLLIFFSICSACAAPPTGSRLIDTRNGLVVKQPPAGSKRGNIFVVFADGFVVGLVVGRHNNTTTMSVNERCPILDYYRPELAKHGLEVKPLPEDTRPRSGKCLARYSLEPRAWDTRYDWVDLQIDVGSGDGVSEEDIYQVLGVPVTDDVNFTVVDHVPLGECRVTQVADLTATCRLDHGRHLQFTRDAALRGGWALLLSRRRQGNAGDSVAGTSLDRTE